MSLVGYAYFWGLGLVQVALVLLPRAPRSRLLAALRSHWLLLAWPAAAITAATFLPPVALALADSLSTVALVAVPSLAAFGVGWALRLHHRGLVLLVPAFFALAWVEPRGTTGEAAGLALVALSTVALAVVVVGILPARVAKIGIGVWAAVDLTFALAHRLEEASRPIVERPP
jgi:hypothetical protein